ncbi:hypothetical protein AS4_33190 [Acinetobacter guillouiae]|nr:hypothetical protein AS4_33190 [Acinetobacter guillouiae]
MSDTTHEQKPCRFLFNIEFIYIVVLSKYYKNPAKHGVEISTLIHPILSVSQHNLFDPFK